MYLVLLINQSDPYCGGDFEFVKKDELLDFICDTSGILHIYNISIKKDILYKYKKYLKSFYY